MARFTLNTGIDISAGSRDPQVLAALAQDTLRHTLGTARLATEFLQQLIGLMLKQVIGNYPC